MIDDLVKRLKETNITVLSQEIYQNDPFARVENLKVKLIIVNVDAVPPPSVFYFNLNPMYS